jgi:hypothetical protein
MTDRLNDPGVFGVPKARQAAFRGRVLDAEERKVAEQRKLVAAWTSFLSRYPWTLNCTFTTRSEYRPARLEDLTNGYLKRLERLHGRRWWWFYVIEVGRAGRWHVHALIGGLDTRYAGSVEDAWTLGRALVEPFAKGRNGAAYIVKQVPHGEALYAFEPNIDARVKAWRQREQHRKQHPRRKALAGCKAKSGKEK